MEHRRPDQHGRATAGPSPGRRLPVPVDLQPWVADIRLGTDDGQPTLVRAPDVATSLVLPHAPAHGGLAVLGPLTRATYYNSDGAPFRIRIRLRPGRASVLLGRPVHGIVDRCVPLGDLWGEPGVRLGAELDGVGADWVRAVRHLAEALLDRVVARPPGDLSRSDLVLAAADRLAATGRVQATAHRLHISQRQLRHLFRIAVGLAPKHFARIDRVRTVLAGVGGTSLARLVDAAGYYDQPHLTAEFREMMGVPPGAYASGRLPAAVPCAR